MTVRPTTDDPVTAANRLADDLEECDEVDHAVANKDFDGLVRFYAKSEQWWNIPTSVMRVLVDHDVDIDDKPVSANGLMCSVVVPQLG
jgi:hypothetical protein